MTDTGGPRPGATVLIRPHVTAGHDGPRHDAAHHRRPRHRRRSLRTRLIGVMAIVAIAGTPAATQVVPASANSRNAGADVQTRPRAVNDNDSLAAQQADSSARSKGSAKAGNSSETNAPAGPGPAARATATRFGVTIQAGGSSYTSAYSEANSRYGGLEVYRKFFSGAPSALPTSGPYAIPVVVSFRYLPRDVLSGRHDAALANWFRAAPTSYPVYWVYSHEPEDDVARGQFTTADYRAAWRHIRTIQRNVGRTDLKASLILMCWTAAPGSHRNWRDYYAGDDVIDVMAWDCYNWGRKSSRPFYANPADMFDRIADLSASIGKPFGIAETASERLAGDNGSQRASWLRSLAAYLSSRNAQFVCYFDSHKAGSVDFRLTDEPSRTAWREIVSA